MDAITVIKKDHRKVEQLFHRFERSRGAAERRRIAADLIRELSVHAAVEEQLVYPRLREQSGEAQVYVALEEHHFAKLALAEIEKLPSDVRLAAKVHVLAENVRHHVKEEERDLLPALRRALSPAQLRELGAALVKAKRIAPTRPHPAAPDEPPGNLLAGAAASAYDRSLGALGRAVEAAREVVAEAIRRGADAADRARKGVKETARDAQDVARTARQTARRARAAVRRTARDAEQVAGAATDAVVH